MRRRIAAAVGAVVLGASLAGAAPSVSVIPYTATSKGWLQIEEAYNNQPTWDGTKPVPAPGDLGTPISAYFSDRWAFIDFGPNWSNLRITQVWTEYMTWSKDNTQIFGQLGWSSFYDSWNIPELINENQIKISNQTALPYSNDIQWARDVDLTDSPVTPQGRYLYCPTLTPAGNSRASEIVFIGYDASTVPEPATIGLLGVGGLLMLKRRRA
jgi:PEP-CTERM motif